MCVCVCVCVFTWLISTDYVSLEICGGYMGTWLRGYVPLEVSVLTPAAFLTGIEGDLERMPTTEVAPLLRSQVP